MTALHLLAPYRKAIVAALVTALTTTIPLLDGGLTAAEVLTILAATLAGSGAVYAVPNAPSASHAQPATVLDVPTTG